MSEDQGAVVRIETRFDPAIPAPYDGYLVVALLDYPRFAATAYVRPDLDEVAVGAFGDWVMRRAQRLVQPDQGAEPDHWERLPDGWRAWHQPDDLDWRLDLLDEP